MVFLEQAKAKLREGKYTAESSAALVIQREKSKTMAKQS